MIRAILKGKLNSSIVVLLNTVKGIGDRVDFHNITKMVPSGTDYTKFLYSCIDFCKNNDGAMEFTVEDVVNGNDETLLTVCPITEQ